MVHSLVIDQNISEKMDINFSFAFSSPVKSETLATEAVSEQAVYELD